MINLYRPVERERVLNLLLLLLKKSKETKALVFAAAIFILFRFVFYPERIVLARFLSIYPCFSIDSLTRAYRSRSIPLVLRLLLRS